MKTPPDFDGWDRRPYKRRVGDAFSQLINTIFGGMPDESLSGRSYRLAGPEPALRQYRPVKPIWHFVRQAAEWLFKSERGQHTRLAFWEDIERSEVRARAAATLKALAHQGTTKTP